MRKTIIAHRGASQYFPENTIEAFEKAIEIGADMIEFDVRKTKDNKFVIQHDEFIQNISIRELTHKDIKGIKSNILLLEEALDCLKGRTLVDIEIKEEGDEKEIIDLVLKCFGNKGLVITSFNDNSVKFIKENYPELKVGLLLGKEKPKNVVLVRFSELFPANRLRNTKADFLAPHSRLLKFGFLQRANKSRIPLFVWGIKDKKAIISLLKKDGVEALIVDNLDDAISSNKSVL